MPTVIEHNRLDLLAMPALLGWLIERWKGEVLAEPTDLVGLAHIAEKTGQIERAMTFAQKAVGSGVAEASAEAHMLLARLERSRHAFDEEEIQLLAAVQCGVSPWMERAHYVWRSPMSIPSRKWTRRWNT